MHPPRKKTLTQTISDNRLALAGLAKLAGKPPPVFSDIKTYAQKKIQLRQLPDWLPVYGDKNFRGDCDLEAYEQKIFVKTVRKIFPVTLGKLITHIKNEGSRSDSQTHHDYSMGMWPGAADIIIISKIPFVLELKRRDPTKSSFSPESVDYLQTAKNQGAFVCCGLGFNGSWQALEAWLELSRKT